MSQKSNAEVRKALVTGASEGIGRAFAKKLAAEGYYVTAVARNEERLKSLLQELGPQHQYLVADLGSDKGITAIEKELFAHHYTLLINNAGFGTYGKFESLAIEKSLEMIKLNIEALVRLSHSFLTNATSGDTLINVSSVLSFAPMPMNGVYSATKAFVTSFSESLWYEQKSRGVFVMGLCPGVTSTLFHKRAGGTDKKSAPAAITETPEAVVENALRALKRRHNPTVVSGHKNGIMVRLMNTLPRKAVLNMMGAQMQDV